MKRVKIDGEIDQIIDTPPPKKPAVTRERKRILEQAARAAQRSSDPTVRELGDVVAKESVELEAKLAELADLPSFKYDQRRKAEAKLLGVRVTSLDDAVGALRGDRRGGDASGTEILFPEIEAADSVLPGCDLLDSLADRIRRHVVMTDVQRDTAALWTMHAHCHDAAEHSPILIFESPEPGCGKTTAMHTVAKLTPRSLETSNVSVAALFRLVEKFKPTIGVDEADTFATDNDELRGLLNSGHDKESARFIRLVGDASNYEPRAYATWSPKMLALLGKRLHPTLLSRSIRIVLERASQDEESTIEPLRKGAQEFKALRAQAAAWSQDHLEALSKAEPKLPAGLRGRDADNWRPLIGIADSAGGDWPKRARAAALVLVDRDEGRTWGNLILGDLRDLFDQVGVNDVLFTEELLRLLPEIPDRPWSDMRGRPITAITLGKLLRPYRDKAVPKTSTTVRRGITTAKGFHREWFKHSFKRYLPESPPSNPSYPSQAQKPAISERSNPSQAKNAVTGLRGLETAENSRCDGVTAPDPPSPEEDENARYFDDFEDDRTGP